MTRSGWPRPATPRWPRAPPRPAPAAPARAAASLLPSLHLSRGDQPGEHRPGERPSGGRLIRTSRDGQAGDTPGTLEDYACVAEGFLTLSGVTGEARWLRLAADLLEVALRSFGGGRGR